MRAPAVAALLLLAYAAFAPSLARAQAQSASARAIQIFSDLCVSTAAARAAILPRLEAEGWSPSTYGSLPTTDNSRRAPDVMNLVGEEPEDTEVFTQIVAGKPAFIHLFTRAREERGRMRRAPTCNVMIVGVARNEFANALLPDAPARSAFMARPFLQQALGGGILSALSSDIDPQHATAPFGVFAMLSFEGPEEEDA